MKIKIILFLVFILTFSIHSDDNTNDKEYDLTSDDLDYYNMEGVTIFSTNESSQHIETIDKEEIDNLNPASVDEILEKKFNLSLNKYGPYGNKSSVSMRGFDGGRILLLIDGIPMNSIQSGQFDLSKISVENIEEIQIIKGGSDTKYNFSGAIGGVINIITKKKSKDNYTISGGISNLMYPNFFDLGQGRNNKLTLNWKDFFDTQKLFLNFGLGNKTVFWNLYAHGTHAFNRYIYEDAFLYKRRRLDNQVWDTGVRTNLMFNLPYYMKLNLAGSCFYDNQEMPGTITSTTVGKQVDHIADASIFFDADYVGHEKIDTEFSVNYKYNRLYWNDPAADNTHSYHTVQTINRWGFMITDWLTLSTGGDFDYSYFDSNHIGQVNVFNGGGYLTCEFSILSKAKIIPSVKLNYYKDYPIAVPKLGLVFFIGQYVTLKSNFYRTFKLPSINDLYWPEDSFAIGNSDLRPEDGIGGDVIFKYHHPKILTLESTFYVNYLRDAILWEPGYKGKWTPLNIGESFYFGLDTSIISNFNKHVELSASYSFLLSYVLNDDSTFEDDLRMPYKPIHTFGFGIFFYWKGGNINLMGHFESERYTTTLNIARLDPFFTMDINFSQKIKAVTITASVKNIFNQLYQKIDGYAMPGMSIQLGVEFHISGNFKNDSEEDVIE